MISCAAFEHAAAIAAAPLMVFTQLSFASDAVRIDRRSCRAGILSALLAAVLVLAGPARAAGGEPEQCGKPGQPWVKFERGDPKRAPQGFEAIVQHVRAELLLRQIEVCLTQTGAPPIATVRLAAKSADAVEVVIEVQDALTKKRVSRLLDLRALPPDARPLAIAVGTDELLRASWVEIAIDTAAAPEEPPPAVVDVVQEELRSEAVIEIGTALVFEGYGGGQRFWGIDARGGARPLPRLSVALRAGLRDGSSAEAPNGKVGASALVLGAAAEFSLLRLSRSFEVELLGRMDAVHVSYLPKADPGAVARSEDDTAVVATGGLSATLALGARAVVFAEFSAGAPLRPVRAADSGDQVVAVSGLSLMTGVGILANF